MFLIAEQTSWLADNGVTTTDDSSRYELDIKLSSTVEANEKQQQPREKCNNTREGTKITEEYGQHY